MDIDPSLLFLFCIDAALRLHGSHSNRIQHSQLDRALSDDAVDCGRLYDGDRCFDIPDGVHQRSKKIDAIEWQPGERDRPFPRGDG